MLNPASRPRGITRFSAFVFALALAGICLFGLAFAAGAPRQRGAAEASHVSQLRLPSARRAGLTGGRSAHRRLRVGQHRLVAGRRHHTAPAAVEPPHLEGPVGGGPATNEAPGVAPESPGRSGSAPVVPPPVKSSPSPSNPPEPEPPSNPPEPEPEPTPEPEPAPEPPAPEPEPPAPEPEPEPEPPAPEPEPEPEPPSEPPPQSAGEVLFAATFDAGFGGWYVQSLPGRASLSSADPYEGDQAARFEVRQGDVEPDTGSQRSEVSGPTFKEGEDLYVRDAIRVPAGNTYSAPWQIIQQWHEEDWSGSPGMAVFLENDRSLRLGAGDGSPVYWKGAALEEDRWYDLVYRMNLSQDASVGFVEVWLDGVQQKLANGQTRMYGQTMQTDETYLKAGIYRSKSSTGISIVEHDSIVVGTSYAAVTGV